MSGEVGETRRENEHEKRSWKPRAASPAPCWRELAARDVRCAREGIVGELLNTRQAAEFFQVSPSTIMRWRRLGFLPTVKCGPGRAQNRTVRYRREDLERLVEDLAFESARDNHRGGKAAGS